MNVEILSSEPILFIQTYYPKCIGFQVTEDQVKIIGVYLRKEAYSNLLHLYGIKFLLALIKFYEYNEQYEKCKDIVDVIKFTNFQHKLNFPTSL